MHGATACKQPFHPAASPCAQVAGLWVLLGLSIALGAGVLCVYALRRHAKYVHKHATRLITAGMAKSRGRNLDGADAGQQSAV